jgi:hypothetical protein
MLKAIKNFGLNKTFYSILFIIGLCFAITMCLPKGSIAIIIFLAIASLSFALLGAIGIVFNEFPSFLFKIEGVMAIILGVCYIISGLFLFITFLSVIIKNL